MNRSRITALLVGTIVFAGAGIAAFALAGGSLTAAEQPMRELLATGEPIPVFEPVPVIEDAWEEGLALAADIQAERELASEAGVVIEAATFFDAPVVGPDSVIPGASALSVGATDTTSAPTTAPDETSPTLGTVDEEPTEAAEPTAPPGPDAESSSTAIDSCAGDGAPESCPEGVPGVVLGLRELPPLNGLISYQPDAPGTAPYPFLPECEPIPPTVGAAPFGVGVNRPVNVLLTYYPDRPGLGPDFTRPASVEASSSPEEDAAWRSWVDDLSAGYDDPRYWMDVCFQIDGIAPGRYLARAALVDKADPSIRNDLREFYFEVLDASGEVPTPGRRPTVLVPAGLDRLYVWATRESAQNLIIRAVRTTEGPATCDTGADDFLLTRTDAGRIAPVTELDREIPESTRTAPDYPYLATHDRSMVYRLDLEEGTNYLVCLYWTTEGPSFDRLRVVESEMVAVTTPDALRPRVNLEGFTNLFGTVETVAVRVDLGSYRDCPPQVLEFEPPYSTERRFAARRLCSLDTGLGDIQARGIPIRLELVDDFGEYQESTVLIRSGRLACRTAPCPERNDEMALVPLPAIPTVRRLCGSGFGGGCSGESPTRSAGDAIISIEYANEPAGTSAEWAIGETSSFVDTPYQPGETTLLSVDETWRSPRTTPGTVELAVGISADRPAELSVVVTGPDGAEACTTGAADLDRSSPLSSEHSLEFAHLCHGASYELVITGTDREGRPAVIHRVGLEPTDRLALTSPRYGVSLLGNVYVTGPDDGSKFFVEAEQFGFHSGEPPPTWMEWVGGNRRSNYTGDCYWGPGTARGRTITRRGPTMDLRASTRASLAQQVLVTLRVEVWDLEFGVRRTWGRECEPGALLAGYDLAWTMPLRDLLEGVILTSDDGLVRVELGPGSA